MKVEAKYYLFKNGSVQCLLCPHNCKLMEGHIGLCKTRKAINEKLYSLSYGNPIAIHVDPVEKKPLYHFFSGTNTFSFGTAGCLLHCENCQNHTISQVYPNELTMNTYSPQVMVAECIKHHCNSISYTYNDPFAFFEYMFDTAKCAKEQGLKNIIVSSAFVNQAPLRALLPYIDAANIDLKCFSNSLYTSLCKGRLDVVLDNLKIIKDSGVWLEITNLVIPGYTDDMEMIAMMAGWLVSNGFDRVPIHFSKFYPNYLLDDVKSTPVATIEKAIVIAKAAGLKYVYSGNVSLANNTSCPTCNNPLVKREGYDVTVNIGFKGRCPKCNSIVDGVFE